LRCAAPVDLARFARDLAAADRALAIEPLVQVERRCIRRAPVDDRADDLGNHVAGAAHDHGVADAHVLAVDLVLVVQGRVAHRGAADEHRLQLRDRRQLAGAADLHVDVQQQRGLLLRRVLVRDGPARLARLEAELRLLRTVVELVDDAVDVERQRVTARGDRLVVRDQAFGALDDAAVVVDRQAHLLEHRAQTVLRAWNLPALDLAERVGEEAQRPFRRLARVELAHHAGGRVARVHKSLLTLRTALDQLALTLVERLEVVTPHEHFAAHLDHRRLRRLGAAQSFRHGRDHAHGVGHVLAGLAVAAGRGLHQFAALVAQADRQAVELELGKVSQRRRVVGERERLAHAGVELLGAGRRGVGLGVDRQHRHLVAHRPQAVEHRTDHALGRRIGCQQPGLRGLDRLQFLEQLVVFGIGDLRRVERVVEMRVALQFGTQRRGAGRGVFRGIGRHAPKCRQARRRLQPAGSSASSLPKLMTVFFAELVASKIA